MSDCSRDGGDRSQTNRRRQRGSDRYRPVASPDPSSEVRPRRRVLHAASAGASDEAMLRRHYADLAHMEDALIESAADWTIVRPPRLTNGSLTGACRVARARNLRRGLSISRADIAHFMRRALEDPTTIRQIIGVAD